MPRSGTTLLRKYLELITGVPTGSDMSLMYAMPLQLAGFIGEAIVDSTCWIIKTHDPVRPHCKNFTTNKIIVCVRNPIDVINSMIHFLSCWSHSKEMANNIWDQNPDYFEEKI